VTEREHKEDKTSSHAMGLRPILLARATSEENTPRALFCSENQLGEHIKFCPNAIHKANLCGQRVHTPVPEEVGQQNLPDIYPSWLLSAQSCIEKLVDESHFCPLQLINVESGLRGLGFNIWAEKRSKHCSF